MKKQIEQVNIDFDDLLYGLLEVNTNFIKREYGISLKREEIVHWNYLIDNFPRIIEVWSNWKEYKEGKMMEGSIEFVNDTNDLFGAKNVNILTASHPNIEKEKDKMISDIFPGNNIVHAYNPKHTYSNNSIMIDDNLDNVSGHATNNSCPGVIFDQGYGWNQKRIEKEISGLHRVKNYNEALQIFEHIKKYGY